MAKLTDSAIRSLIDKRVSQAITASELEDERQKALDYYYGRPMGTEQPGRAQVVTKDLMDTIEWMMPSLMRVFATKQAVQFDPVGPEDEELAKQETGYVSHVLWKQNDGFMLIYSWLKDALMQKVGYVKYWWEEEDKVREEEYTGLTQDQLVLTLESLSQRGEVEVIGAEASHTAPGVVQTWDVRLRLTETRGCLRVAPVPPEEIIVSRDCRGSVKNAKFVGHLRRLTRSELLEMGYERAEIQELTSYSYSHSDTDQARDTVGESDAGKTDEGVDWATEELELLECHTYVDADDDGVAELRHFLMGGDTILENEVVDEIQVESWTPIPTPHRHIGLSIFDLVEDLQRIHTALTRGLLDSTYFTMNPRTYYNKNTVNLRMLQVNRPGGHVAVDGPPGPDVYQPTPPNMSGHLLPVIAHVQAIRERRTGVGDMTTGVDADVLAKSTKGAYMDAKGAANQRIEAIARIFAETGLSSLYASMHRMLSKHQDWPARFRLRDQWVEVNPTEWMERANLTVSVGLGTAAKEEVRANLGVMAQAQTQAAAMPGLIQPKNVYALFRRMQTELGFEAEDFITDPASPEYQQATAQQPPPPDPYIEGKKIDQQTRLQEKSIESRDKALDRNQDLAIAVADLEISAGVDLAAAGLGAELRQPGAGGPARRGGPAAAGQSPPA